MVALYCLIISSVLYTLIAISNFIQRDYPHGIIWSGYTLGQLGFIWYELLKLRGG